MLRNLFLKKKIPDESGGRHYSVKEKCKVPGWRNDQEIQSVNPDDLLRKSEKFLVALRMEAGLYDREYEVLIETLIRDIAAYIHALPATRSLHHSEEGGLFKYCLETGFLAFRRADGRLFVKDNVGEGRNRQERAWRYAALLGGLFKSIGAAATHLKVSGPGLTGVWNPYQLSLFDWIQEQRVSSYSIMWAEATDAIPTGLSSLWLASNLIPSHALHMLGSADPQIIDHLLRYIGEHNETTPLAQLVDGAAKAIEEKDLSRIKTPGVSTTGISIEHRILDAIRGMVRESWAINRIGARLWITTQGIFLVWKPSVIDVQMRLKANGVVGIPEDSDTIAEILLEKGALIPNEYSHTLPHHYRISINAPRIPKQPMDVVRLANPAALGITMNGVEPLEVTITGQPEAQSPARSLDADAGEFGIGENKEHPGYQEDNSAQEGMQTQLGDSDGEDQSHEHNDIPAQYRRYGEVGSVLYSLSRDIRLGKWEKDVRGVEDGIAISYPEVIQAYIDQPHRFISECRKRNMVVRDLKISSPAAGQRGQTAGGNEIVLNKRVRGLVLGE